MSEIVKIPCILVATVGWHVSHTPPNPVSPDSEHAPVTTPGEKLLRLWRAVVPAEKAIFWGAGLAEVVAIIANKSPSSSLSQYILPTVIVRGSADDLGLSPLSVLGFCLIIFGSLVRWQCYRTLERLFTFEVSLRENHKLVTTGPYSIVRHPSYTGWFAVYIGMFCWYGARGSWLRESGVLGTDGGRAFIITIMPMLLWMLVSMPKRGRIEDAHLHAAFGKEWEAWARKVPYSLLPGVY